MTEVEAPATSAPPVRVRRWRATGVIAIAIIVVGVVHALMPGGLGHGTRAWAIGPDALLRAGEVWRLVLAPASAPTLPGVVIAVVAVLVVGPLVEARLGSVRTLVVWMLTGIVGAAAGLAVELIGILVQENAAVSARSGTFADVLPGLLGALLCASIMDHSGRLAGIPALVGTVVLALLLYTGDLSNVGRLGGAAAGLAVGFAFGGRRPASAWSRSSHARARRILAVTTAVVAIGPLLVFFGPRQPGLLSGAGAFFIAQPDWKPTTLASGFGWLDVVMVLALAIAAYGIARGSRFAAMLAIGLNLVTGVAALLGYVLLPWAGSWFEWDGFSDVELNLTYLAVAIVPLGLSVVLLLNLRHFGVHLRPAAARRGAIAGIGLVLGAAILYVVGCLVAGAGLGDIVAGIPSRFVPPGFLNAFDLGLDTLDPAVRIVGRWVALALWSGMLLLAFRLAASAPDRDGDVALDVRHLLRRHGGGTLGFMATWPGNRVWTSVHGDAAVAYRVIGAVAIGLSQPIAAPEREEAVIREFARWCDDRGWTPVFFTAPERLRPIFDAMGWRALDIGSEAVLGVDGFDLRGKRKQNIRTALNRAEREGLTAEWVRFADLDPHLVREVRRVSDEWVAAHALPEMGFTLGGVDQLADPDVRLMLAIGPDRRVHAVTSWLPVFDDGVVTGYTLDVMRRDARAMPGVIEFLIAQTAFRGRADGLSVLSLSAVPLVVPETSRRGRGAVLARASRVLEPVYGFRSLAAFKARFEPETRPLLLACPHELALPRVSTALVRAYLPPLSVGIVIRIASLFLRLGTSGS